MYSIIIDCVQYIGFRPRVTTVFYFICFRFLMMFCSGSDTLGSADRVIAQFSFSENILSVHTFSGFAIVSFFAGVSPIQVSSFF